MFRSVPRQAGHFLSELRFSPIKLIPPRRSFCRGKYATNMHRTVMGFHCVRGCSFLAGPIWGQMSSFCYLAELLDNLRICASCFNTGEQFMFGTQGFSSQPCETAGSSKQRGKAQGKNVDALGGLRAGIARRDPRSIESMRIDFYDAFRLRWAHMGDSCRYLKGRILASRKLLKLACCVRTFGESSGESGGCGRWRESYLYCSP
jgi:hypothetical protein